MAVTVLKLLFSFDEFILDPERRELRGPTGPISVEPQVFDFLVYLIRNRDRVVSKDDIIAAIWAGRIVSESVLTTRRNAARSAIGDSGAAQRLIRTLARKGMRFVGNLREEQAFAIAAPPDQRRVSSPVLDLPDRPSIVVLPFINIVAIETRNISLMARSKISLPRSRASEIYS